jgi:sugar porter (SP) family MFS transporter
MMPTHLRTINGYLLKATIVAALGGLLFGFDTAVIAGTTHALREQFSLSEQSIGLTVSIALWGTVIGSLFAGIPGERWGRKAALMGLAILYLVSALGCALAWDWTSLVVFRFLGGLGIGGSSVLGPMYIAEIAPARVRGRLVGCFQFNIVLGILVAYLSNYLVGSAGFGMAEWRWKLGVAAVPALFFLLMLMPIPQSPRWLVAAGREGEAREVLRLTGEANVDEEVRQIRATVAHEQGQSSEPLFRRAYAFPIFLAVSIGMFNQLSGINAILYYLNDIFAKAGFDKVSADVQSVAIGATNLLFTVIAMSLIDRLGRKKLLLTGAVGTGICLAGVAWIFSSKSHEKLLLPLLIGYIACFAFSQGAVIWVYLSEVFPNRVRAKGQSLGSFTHWIMNAGISWLFPIVAVRGAEPFMFFAAMMVVQFFVVLFLYPETKGITLEEVDKKLGVIAH